MSPMLLEIPREVGGVLVTEGDRRLLDGTADPQKFERLPLPLLSKPDLGAFAHLFVKESLQCPH